MSTTACTGGEVRNRSWLPKGTLIDGRGEPVYPEEVGGWTHASSPAAHSPPSPWQPRAHIPDSWHQASTWDEIPFPVVQPR